MNSNAPPDFLFGEDFSGIIICTPARNHRDFMTALHQLQGEIRKVLPA
jgi:hypothetical protein